MLKLFSASSCFIASVHHVEIKFWSGAGLVSCRLEGFKEPWEMTVYKGRALLPDKTLEECGVTSGTHLITVRRVLIKEGLPV